MEKIVLAVNRTPLNMAAGKVLTKNQKRKLKQKNRKQSSGVSKKRKISKSDECSTNSAVVNKYQQLIDELKNYKEGEGREGVSDEEEIRMFFHSIYKVLKEETIYEEQEDVDKMHSIEIYCGKLFKMLDEKAVPKFILTRLCSIKGHLLSQNYLVADQEYFSMTIGNSPWPSHSKSNILNDDDQRNIILSLKRLISFWQTVIYPLTPKAASPQNPPPTNINNTPTYTNNILPAISSNATGLSKNNIHYIDRT